MSLILVKKLTSQAVSLNPFARCAPSAGLGHAPSRDKLNDAHSERCSCRSQGHGPGASSHRRNHQDCLQHKVFAVKPGTLQATPPPSDRKGYSCTMIADDTTLQG